MWVELNHIIEAGMETYPGLPAPRICDFWQRDSDNGIHVAKMDWVVNTGTYLDAPFHRYADGPDIAELPLEAIAAKPGICVQVSAGLLEIDHEVFAGLDLRNKAVLVHCGWDRHWGTSAYAEPNPHLTPAAAELLLEAGAALVGIDSVNIDNRVGESRPVHEILLAAGIPIVEHLTNLSALPDKGFRFFAMPARVKGVGSFPVRACAELPAD